MIKLQRDPHEYYSPYRIKFIAKLAPLSITTGNEHEEMIKKLLAKPFKIPIEGYTGKIAKINYYV